MDPDELDRLRDEWQRILPQIRLLCHRIGGAGDRGDEIFQRTNVKVLRGLPGFRGQASLRTWAGIIARHEADRLFAQQITERRKRAPVPVEELTDLEMRFTGAEGVRRKAAILAIAARTAAMTGQLSEVEAKVVLARLDHPNASWDEIGVPLSLSPGACAAAHCRAILDLRVYIFRA